MKDKILKILNSSLAGAQDNLHRAKLQFSNGGLDEEYGQSGKTGAKIVGDYFDEVKEIERCVAWVNEKQD